MDVTEQDVTAIPVGNLRVSVGEFAAVWAAAERRVVEDPADWYFLGVAVTCRWMARATVRPVSGPWYVQWAPVTKRKGFAYEELIEAECLAADGLLHRRPVPRWLLARPGWAEAIVDTFGGRGSVPHPRHWAWPSVRPADPMRAQPRPTAS